MEREGKSRRLKLMDAVMRECPSHRTDASVAVVDRGLFGGGGVWNRSVRWHQT